MSRLRSTPGARLKVLSVEIAHAKMQVRLARRVAWAWRRRVKKLVAERDALSTKSTKNTT